MASEEIGDLSAAAALTGSEIVHVVQGGESLRTTTAAIGGLATAFKNLIVNGDMRVNQEGNKTGVGNGEYGCDLFRIAVIGAALYDLTQIADGPPGFANCLEVKVATADASLAAGDYSFIEYFLEGQNLQHARKGLASAKAFQFTIWTKTNKAGIYPVELLDNDNSRISTGSITVVGTGTWEEAIISFPADTTGAFDSDANASLIVNIWLSAGTNYTSGTAALAWAASVTANRAADLTVNFADTIGNYMRITGAQLEVGDTATEFEHLPYDVQLQRVQRYFCKTEATARWPAAAGGQFIEFPVYWPRTMRASPSATLTAGSRSNVTAATLYSPNINRVRFNLQSTAAGDAYAVGDVVTADARL